MPEQPRPLSTDEVKALKMAHQWCVHPSRCVTCRLLATRDRLADLLAQAAQRDEAQWR